MIVSFASLIGASICLWIILYSTATQFLISEQEYLLSYNAYEINACEQPIKYEADQPVPRTDQEIATCKTQKTSEVLVQRAINFKESLIWWVSWGVVFLLLFLFHYPVFRKLSNEEKN